jgi:uncharacterized protein (TIGR02646 family)
MNGLNLTEADTNAIKLAMSEGGDIWNSSHLKPLKRKIKTYYRNMQGEQCCYCRKNSNGEFNMVLDIEHVLPKGRPEFKKFMFRIENLSVACKRCNMSVKNDDISFISGQADFSIQPFFSGNYKFIHPNVDNYFDHLSYDVTIRNAQKMIKYTAVNDSAKGQFTYDYFKLNELEVDSFSKAQGAQEMFNVSSSIDDDIAHEIEELLG